MKTIAKLLLNTALAGVVLAGAGCRQGLTTAMVWKIDEYHPARIPRLQLSTVPGTNDVLVQYDECFVNSQTLRPRAYWLFDYAAKDTNALRRPQPEFIRAGTLTNLCPIPQVERCGAIPANGYGVRLSTSENSFQLLRDGRAVGEYHLPIYSNAPPATWGRVLLTPVTVTTDAAIVTAVISGFVLMCCPPMIGGG